MMRHFSISVDNIAAICAKELHRYFASPIGYVLLLGSAVLAGPSVYISDPAVLMRHVFTLSQFSPSREFILQCPRVILLVGFVRVIVLLLIPAMSMRLFIEERRSRAIEMLFTSPIQDHEIVLGKWSGAMLMYTFLLAVPAIELGLFRWPDLDWRAVFKTHVALISQGAGLLAIGECISTFTRHEVVAAAGTFVVCLAVFQNYDRGTMSLLGFAFCGALLVGGWALTWRSIRAFRGRF